jgi:hypothetical protein
MYAFGLFSAMFPVASGMASILPRRREGSDRSRGLLVGVASSVLHLPLVGLVFAWMGFVPASWRSLRAACATSSDVAIIPGGIAEMTAGGRTCPRTGEWVETLVLKERRGFLRLALRTGRTVVPVYAFGETRTFVQYRCWQRAREAVSRRLRVVVSFFRGRWFTLVPFRTPIEVVVGEPIPTRGPVAAALGLVSGGGAKERSLSPRGRAEPQRRGPPAGAGHARTRSSRASGPALTLARRKRGSRSRNSEEGLSAADLDAEDAALERLHALYCERLMALFEAHKGLHPDYEDARLELR